MLKYFIHFYKFSYERADASKLLKRSIQLLVKQINITHHRGIRKNNEFKPEVEHLNTQIEITLWRGNLSLEGCKILINMAMGIPDSMVNGIW